MHRYFANKISDKIFSISADKYHHFKNVVRLKIGETIELIADNTGYIGKIVNYFDNGEIELEVLKTRVNKNIATIAIIGLIREQKWNLTIQKLTELGVTDIVPVQFNRSVVKIDKQKVDSKITRWTSICKEAAEQSRQTNIPIVHNIVFDIRDLKYFIQDQNFIAYELQNNNKLLIEPNKTTSFIIGPEGGLDENEVSVLTSFGYNSISLGEKILRAETASIYFMSVINYVNNL